MLTYNVMECELILTLLILVRVRDCIFPTFWWKKLGLTEAACNPSVSYRIPTHN